MAFCICGNNLVSSKAKQPETNSCFYIQSLNNPGRFYIYCTKRVGETYEILTNLNHLFKE